ncbi:hypothetical protein [Salegentibacter maritimus]|uniref:hypothetical protein n=1 Tax=Salegentibacter maritimus TaxID=2794347 RepID=UPI0018E461B2|nr:hypothetical protein [Salegentibacter maritimus]MBI6118341.1 hypothetical protein [Salegentibacter maritimus]
MHRNKKIELQYLPNFKEEEMEVLLIEYERYNKFSNSVKIPLIILLPAAGIMRSIKNKLSTNILVVIAIVILLVLAIWLIVIANRIIKQKRIVNKKLKAMANAQQYPFNKVKKEFNVLVRKNYKGSKI